MGLPVPARLDWESVFGDLDNLHSLWVLTIDIVYLARAVYGL